MAVTHNDTAHHSRQATNVYGLFSLSLSIYLSLRLSPHTHTLGKPEHHGRERRADWMRARASRRSSCDWKMHGKNQEKVIDPASSVPGSGCGLRTAGCSQIEKGKKKKKKKKSHHATKIQTRVTWDQVRPGTSPQHGPKAFVCIRCSVSQHLFFLASATSPRAFFLLRPTCCRASHNETPTDCAEGNQIHEQNRTCRDWVPKRTPSIDLPFRSFSIKPSLPRVDEVFVDRLFFFSLFFFCQSVETEMTQERDQKWHQKRTWLRNSDTYRRLPGCVVMGINRTRRLFGRQKKDAWAASQCTLYGFRPRCNHFLSPLFLFF